jgi:hypothetical protein
MRGLNVDGRCENTYLDKEQSDTHRFHMCALRLFEAIQLEACRTNLS